MENTHENQPSEDRTWLNEIAQKSWEPELLVSGAAIYLTSNLPAWIDNFYNFYTIDIQADADSVTSVLPLLSFSFLSIIAYLLIFAFVAHFVMRAFWVAVVGLLSVFPQDIQYEKLPSYTPYFKEKLREHLGSLSDYTTRLDKTCSSLLSLAFLMAMTLVGVSGIYVLCFACIKILGLLIPAAIFEKYERIIYFSFLSLMFVFSLIILALNLPMFKNKPAVNKFQFRFYIFFNNLPFPFISKPRQRISNIFMSNISPRRYYTAVAILGLAIIGGIPLTFKSKATQNWIKGRLFYSKGAPQFELERNYYENLRDKNQPIVNNMVIQSDIIQDDFLKIFIGYPKRLDKELEKICVQSLLTDSLGKEKKKELLDRNAIICLNRFHQIYLNDSLYQSDFIFYKHHTTDELGLITYLPTQQLKVGKNMLRMILNYTDSTRKKQSEQFVPFWYMP
jgi:hypothetical protein